MEAVHTVTRSLSACSCLGCGKVTRRHTWVSTGDRRLPRVASPVCVIRIYTPSGASVTAHRKGSAPLPPNRQRHRPRPKSPTWHSRQREGTGPTRRQFRARSRQSRSIVHHLSSCDVSRSHTMPARGARARNAARPCPSTPTRHMHMKQSPCDHKAHQGRLSDKPPGPAPSPRPPLRTRRQEGTGQRESEAQPSQASTSTTQSPNPVPAQDACMKPASRASRAPVHSLRAAYCLLRRTLLRHPLCVEHAGPLAKGRRPSDQHAGGAHTCCPAGPKLVLMHQRCM